MTKLLSFLLGEMADEFFGLQVGKSFKLRYRL